MLAFVVSALCFCSTSPTSPNKTDLVKQPFEVCVSAWDGGWVDIYPYDSINYKNPVKPKMLTVYNNHCEPLDLPDGTVITAYYFYPGSSIGTSTRKNYMVHAGDYWNL